MTEECIHSPKGLLGTNRKRGYNLQELCKIGQLKTRKNFAWSDESQFLLRHSDGRVRIW